MNLKSTNSKKKKLNMKRPGSIWHIYKPEDTNKIREILKKRRTKFDPIHHDEHLYLNSQMRATLKNTSN